MLPTPDQLTVATHWGIYRARHQNGKLVALDPYEADPDPSPIGSGMVGALTNDSRIARPAIRKSFLEKGYKAGGEGRGSEPFVEVPWDEALDIVAGELARVRDTHGNGSLYGGSYGWGSAGRFHHAQSQIHRFLNSIGGYLKSVQSYSYGAAEVILPHVLGDRRGLMSDNTTWPDLAGHAQLIVMFGGTPHKNAQVNSGGLAAHAMKAGLESCQAGGARFVTISPIGDDTMAALDAQWIGLRPNTDVALMLGLAYTLLSENLHAPAFLNTYTTGFERFARYLTGESDGQPKSADWAAGITGVSADTIRSLARDMAAKRTFIMTSWSLQRAHHGEQPYWMTITLAAMLGQIGLQGGGFGFGYGSVNGIGNPIYSFSWPSLAQGTNAVTDFIPVSRIADMLLSPGQPYDYDGERRIFPDARLVYWAGGNPFHHHQNLNRLIDAWRKPEVVIIQDSWWNASARHADIVLPVTTALERNDIACSGRDYFISASHRVAEPAGEARDDYAIFSSLAQRLGVEAAFTEGRDEEAWLRHLYSQACERTTKAGMSLPSFEDFWKAGVAKLPPPGAQPILLADYRADGEARALKTPSGRIEIYSSRIESFGYADCPGHPTWMEPSEWLGADAARRFPLHLISNQPATKLHSQYDNGSHALAAKIKGREPLRLSPQDAATRGLQDGDVVRVFNDRGACLAGVIVWETMYPGVVQMATGAWYDPAEPGVIGSLDKHGNPNVLTQDHGTSKLAQSTSAQTCLVEIERYDGELPPITCFSQPAMVPRTA